MLVSELVAHKTPYLLGEALGCDLDLGRLAHLYFTFLLQVFPFRREGSSLSGFQLALTLLLLLFEDLWMGADKRSWLYALEGDVTPLVFDTFDGAGTVFVL